MGSIYLIIVIFLLVLAVFDLFVGVSNDAVNFLQYHSHRRIREDSAQREVWPVIESGYPVVHRTHLVLVGDHRAVHPAGVAISECRGLLADSGALREGRQFMRQVPEMLECALCNLVWKDMRMGIED